MLLAAVIGGCRPGGKDPDLTVACAASVQYAMEELVDSFEDANSISCEVIVGSSGKLTAQIINGAPYDLFVSADVAYPDRLFQEGLAVTAPQIYGYGRLVLWTSTTGSVPTFENLSETANTKIAVANPRLAPYGVASLQVLEQLERYERIKPKLVFGESIAQVNQFITTGVAEVGFTSLSTVKAPDLDTIGRWLLVPDSLHQQLPQAALCLASSRNEELAQGFMDFTLSTPGKRILARHGYDTLTNVPSGM